MIELRRFRTLAKNWEAFGETDPLFSVLSDPTKLGGKWALDEFFASGHAHVEKLLSTLAAVPAPFERGACLDFGCGVGRLTVPLSDSFRRTVGVDVARSMIASARRHLPTGVRCEFIVNRDPDLRQFPDDTFDLVHSCLVLQHMPAEIAACYIAEFLRVCRRGGLVVFQVPAVRWTEAEVSAQHALPDAAFAAAIAFVHSPDVLEVSASALITVRVTNRGPVTWRHDIPGGRHLSVGNHWLLEDGARVLTDDGRASLPKAVGPGETADISVTVQAPDAPGRYLLEVDMVQEEVAWFCEKGSPTARVTVDISGGRDAKAVGPVVPLPSEAPPHSPPRIPALNTRRFPRGRTP